MSAFQLQAKCLIASRSGKHAGIQVLFGGPPGIFLRISRASGEQVAQGDQRLAGLRQGDLLPVEEVAVQQQLRLLTTPATRPWLK